ncbi:MAG: carbohydrate kinase family protein [Alphaproteobacteria bacterium]|nr:carbohydrate kinase family protein [Alphaproteobacteria bacterium]
MTARFLVAGGIIIDNVVAADGAVHRALMGGNAVHAAVGARLWTDSVAVIGNVPADYPATLLDQLGTAIDIGAIATAEEKVEASEWFLYRADGSRIDRLHAPADAYQKAGFGGDRLSPAQMRRWESVLRAQPVGGADFGSFRRRHPVRPEQIPSGARALHLGPSPPAVQAALVAQARRHGTPVTLDPGFHAASLSVAELQAFLDTVDAFLPSEVELAAMCPGLAPVDAVARLRKRGSALVAAKLGARGSIVAARDGRSPTAIPACEVVPRDPTGAGDAFCGGFLVGLVETGDPVLAACLGTVSAAFAVESTGALAALRADRVLARSRLAGLLAPLRPHLRAADFV